MAGAALDLVFAAVLALVGAVAGNGSVDSVPRWLVLLLVLGTPGAVGLLGALAGRADVVVGAALPLIPAVLLSWSGIALVFPVCAALMLTGVFKAPSTGRSNVLVGIAVAIVLTVLLVAAAVAPLFWLTADTCRIFTAVGESCSSAAITVLGAGVGAALDLVALALAAGLVYSNRRRGVAT